MHLDLATLSNRGPRLRLALLALTMLAFAGNSLLCRLALQSGGLDPADFTLLRLASGALILSLLVRLREGGQRRLTGSLAGALWLLAYAGGFSFAYLSLGAASGALLLFGAVQGTMLLAGLARGEILGWRQWLGVCLAIAGLVVLLMPGLQAPPLPSALLMLGAGVAWGGYSLRGRHARDPLAATAGNFLLATPLALLLCLLLRQGPLPAGAGLIYALLSGALASGLGYALWYALLPRLPATQAATVQLSVPPLAALGAVLLLGEPLGGRLLLSALAILGGIALVIRAPARHADTQSTSRP
ncbi:DMT family transporter [Pseudaeromonas paramecii]|uniref:DMT family transporter n=1 Tax=Pseudaeromonas paramecii TaxID=2138166 RepID=A0ABP8Q6A2_9GAMM